MALLFEIVFAGEDWKNFGFTIVKDGLNGVEQMGDIRLDLEWPPASNTPVYFGSEAGERHISVTGVVEGTSRSDLKTKLEQIKATLADSLTAVQELYFGDQLNVYYEAVYDGTFNVRMIGSALRGTAALITVGFLVFSERAVA